MATPAPLTTAPSSPAAALAARRLREWQWIGLLLLAPASISATNGVCFQTKAMTMPVPAHGQSTKLCACSGSMTPVPISAWFINPFFARKPRITCAVTMNGMNSGHR